jgi:hypothetical protein
MRALLSHETGAAIRAFIVDVADRSRMGFTAAAFER